MRRMGSVRATEPTLHRCADGAKASGRIATTEVVNRPAPVPVDLCTMAFARIFALSLLVSAPVMTAGFDADAATPEAQAPAARMSIKATVEHDGTKLDASKESDVGQTAKLRASNEAHAHDLSVTILPQGDKGFRVKLGYTRDGKRILKSKTLDASSGAFTVDAGGSKITLSLAPAKPKRTRIEMPDSDDPLAGL